jgi:hypothetical protein
VVSEDQKEAAQEAAKKAREDKLEIRAMFVSIEAATKLTDEQQAKFAKIAPELSAVHQEMMKELTKILTPEQKEKLKQARTKGKKQSKEE